MAARKKKTTKRTTKTAKKAPSKRSAARKPPPNTLNIGDKEIAQVEAMAGFGLTATQMASVLGMCEKTFYNKKNTIPEFASALERGRALTSYNVRKTAYQMATSGDWPAMTIFWLKCRENWKPADNDIDRHVNINLNYVPKSQRAEPTTAVELPEDATHNAVYDWE